MKIKDIMTKTIVSVKPEDSVEHAAKIMKEYDVGSVPVCNGDEIIGIITDRDIAIRSCAGGEDINNQDVRGIMSSNPVLCEPNMEVEDVARIMSERQIRRLPVVENSSLVGIVSLGDLAIEPHANNKAGEALTNISEPCSPHL